MPLQGGLPLDLAERVLPGGADASHVLRLLGLQLLMQLASSGVGQSSR